MIVGNRPWCYYIQNLSPQPHHTHVIYVLKEDMMWTFFFFNELKGQKEKGKEG